MGQKITYIRTHKETILKNFIAIVILISLFFVEGCFNAVDLKFEFERALKIDFWIRIGTRLTLLFLIKTLALDIFIPYFRKNNDELANVKKMNQRYMKLKEKDFPIFIDDIKNVEIRVNAWKEKINRKLSKLEHHAKNTDRVVFYKGTPEEKEFNKYCQKRNEYEYLLSDEYIENNKYCLNVKCPRIIAAVFDTPVEYADLGSLYQISSKIKLSVIASLTISSFWLVAVQIVREAMALSRNNASILVIILGIVFDLCFMFYQFFSGIMDSAKIIDKQEVCPYTNRNRILKEYIYWKEPDKESKITQLLEFLEKENEKEDEKEVS